MIPMQCFALLVPQKAIFSIKVKVEVTRSLALMSFIWQGIMSGVCMPNKVSRQTSICDSNKSPKLDFSANQKAWLPHLWYQSKQQTIGIFQFRIRGCIRFVAVAFRSEEEVLRRKGLSLIYFCATCHVCIRNLCNRFGVMFSQYSWFPVVINYMCSVTVSSYLSSLHTLEPIFKCISYAQTKNITPPWIHEKPKRMCRAMITSSLLSLVNIHQSIL